MFACFCLNILIETGPPSDFQKVTAESLNLSETEKDEAFFKQEFVKVGRLNSIRKVHSCIVQSMNFDSWTVTRCANCECYSHAVHRESGVSFVLVYKNLLDSEAIATLKASDSFSPIYKIVVNFNLDTTSDIRFGLYQPREVEASIRDLRLMMNEYIRKETLVVTNQLEDFRKQLYDEYDQKKDRACKEQVQLGKVVQLAYEQMSRGSTWTNLPTASKSPPRLDRLADDALSSGFSKLLLNTGHTPRHGSPTTVMHRPPKSYDAEGVFDFEGTDEAPSLSSSDHNISDGEEDVNDPDELFIPRPANKGPKVIAQSLPMNIPAFMQDKHRSTEDMEVPQGENVNIAESMKALAQSVHGDAVFGDLPRPRLSSQH